MTKNRYLTASIFLALLSLLSEKPVMAEEYVKKIEIVDSGINFSQTEFPRTAYLCMELKNNGDKSIANLDLEVSYYDTEGCLIKKAVLKNRLKGAILPGEARKYKIRLNGDVFNAKNEEYPYSQREKVKVGEFDIRILSVKFV